MKPKVYITRKLPEEVVADLYESCQVTMWEKEEVPVPYEELEKQVQDADGILCLLTESIDANLLKKSPRLKIISNMAVGYNNIDVSTAKAQGILITNTPGVLTETTADLTFGLLIATARRFEESMDYVKKGKWATWSPMQLTGQDVYGSTLGIIGMGDIGEGIARRAKGFDMNVLYHNRSRKLKAEKELGVTYCDLQELLKQSNFVVVMTPYTPQTHHLISYAELSLMKPTSILINTSRGGIVDEEALYEALAEKRIWAAGLDVFEREPVSPDHPLLQLPNVVALPHIGSASIATRTKMGKLAAHNLLEGLKGNTPPNLVL
ncbi:D-glycerate dehydrogenase [Ammoniphilus sp. YIM 78166]|uniref:2-hydroxyacid dehydrogenase n=1 Tax=Ammoniphilus sp. YIM 78166 TaxID=1644106 RepID=UPI00106FFBF0|nr:D-glycerate dehydrogenase [Ammoniphilus sp. YIM 78166]